MREKFGGNNKFYYLCTRFREKHRDLIIYLLTINQKHMINIDHISESSSYDDVVAVLSAIGREYEDRLENDSDFQLFYYIGEGPLKDFRDLRLKKLGKILSKNDGLEGMQRAYYSIPHDRAIMMALNAIWDGIGDWVS